MAMNASLSLIGRWEKIMNFNGREEGSWLESRMRWAGKKRMLSFHRTDLAWTGERLTPWRQAGCYHPHGGVVSAKRRGRSGLNGGSGIGRECEIAQGRVLKSTKPHCLI